jgi:hypothetical protein
MILPEKLTVPQTIKKFLAVFWNPKVHYRLDKSNFLQHSNHITHIRLTQTKLADHKKNAVLATGPNISRSSGRVQQCAAAAVRMRSHLKSYCSEIAADAAVSRSCRFQWPLFSGEWTKDFGPCQSTLMSRHKGILSHAGGTEMLSSNKAVLSGKGNISRSQAGQFSYWDYPKIALQANTFWIADKAVWGHIHCEWA